MVGPGGPTYELAPDATTYPPPVYGPVCPDETTNPPQCIQQVVRTPPEEEVLEESSSSTKKRKTFCLGVLTQKQGDEQGDEPQQGDEQDDTLGDTDSMEAHQGNSPVLEQGDEQGDEKQQGNRQILAQGDEQEDSQVREQVLEQGDERQQQDDQDSEGPGRSENTLLFISNTEDENPSVVARDGVPCTVRVRVFNYNDGESPGLPYIILTDNNRKILLLCQRAMSQMSGYFGGYISKKQKVGQFELKRSIDALPLLKEKLQRRPLKASAQLAHVCNRFFGVLESKGILRTATEEFLLASRYRPDDELNAEFIRTFNHQRFTGMAYLQRYEQFKAKKSAEIRNIKIPATKTISAEFDEVML